MKGFIKKKIEKWYKTRYKPETAFLESFTDIVLADTQLGNVNFKDATLVEIGSLEEFLEYKKKMEPVYAKRTQLEKLLALNGKDFTINGYNPMIDDIVTYKVNYNYSTEKIDGVKVPNYRESLLCDRTGSNSRMRATVLAIKHLLKNDTRNLSVYLTEQVTQLYHYYKERYANVTGSEYLGPDVPKGEIINGIRHEDVTDLSLKDNEFDLIITLEVLEHVPNYKKSYKELLRCTKEGGTVIISVPFITQNYENLIRAKINDQGEIEHILPPEYHGDPVNPEGGILCFQHFGWQMLDELREAGFREVKAVFVWSMYHGILGRDIMVISAKK